MKKAIILLLAVLTSATVFGQQKIDFYRENVVIEIDASHAKVSAELFFRNPSDRALQQMMFFPLPLRTSELKRDSLSVFDVSRNAYIKSLVRNPAGIIFSLNFQPQDAKKLRIYTCDDHNGTQVSYLQMTHANYWGKPISQGTYTVRYDARAITVDSLTCKPESTVTEDGTSTLSWKKSNFTPDKELTVWFHRNR